jgi:hypothetical protein
MEFRQWGFNHKIEDVDTCEIIIGKLLEDKAIDAVLP